MSRNRLIFLDRCIYDQAFSTFIKAKPKKISDDEKRFLKSILQFDDSSEEATIQNAINLVRSWAELKQDELPQTVMNNLFEACMKFPQFIPQLFLFIPFFPHNGWLFRAIIYYLKVHIQEFKKTIQENHDIWRFLLPEFMKDFQSKANLINLPIYERTNSFLIESLIFLWPLDKPSHVQISDLTTSLVQFLIPIENSLSNQLLSLLCMSFFDFVSPLVLNIQDRLMPQCLALMIKRGLTVEGNPQIIGIKIYPWYPEKAREILREAGYDMLIDALDQSLTSSGQISIKI